MNPVSAKVSVKIGSLGEGHQFVTCNSSPVNLLGRDLLCKLNCVIYCTPDSVELQTHDENVDFNLSTQKSTINYSWF